MSQEPDISGTEFIEGGELSALVRRPQPQAGPHPVAVMIHGWGAKESDIYELVPFIERRVMIVAPRGPYIATDDPRGSFMWYERKEPGQPDETTLKASVEKLHRLLDQLNALTGVEIDPAQVYFGGFSQGGTVSAEMAATYPDRLAGIIEHSGGGSPWARERLRAGIFRGKGAFVAHGSLDEVVPPANGQQLRQALDQGGADVTFREYQVGHGTTLESRRDLADWLNRRLR